MALFLPRSFASGRIAQCPWLLAGDSVVHVVRVGTERQKCTENFHHLAEPGKYGSADFESELRRTVELPTGRCASAAPGRMVGSSRCLHFWVPVVSDAIRRQRDRTARVCLLLKPARGARRFVSRPRPVKASASRPDLDKKRGIAARVWPHASDRFRLVDAAVQRCNSKYGLIAAKRILGSILGHALCKPHPNAGGFPANRVYRSVGDKIERGPQRFCVLCS